MSLERIPEATLRDARAGRAVALDTLLADAAPAVRRYLARLLGARLGRHVSLSDLEQEVLIQGLQILRRLPADATLRDFRALLFQHARWAVGKAAERNRRAVGESEAGVGEAVNPTRSLGPVTRADQLHWFGTEVARLPEDLREVVALRREGWTFPRIGAELGIGEDAARRRFLRAAVRLQSHAG